MSGRLAACLSILVLAACAPAEPEGAQGDLVRPNVVVVLTDDQRFDSMGCTGNPHVETPELDRLAREGVLYSRSYVVTSLCCPARATLLAGLYTHETGIRSNSDTGPFLANARGFPERLQRVGYRTGFVGKWHIENPLAEPQPGFDYWVSFEGQGQYENETYNINGEREVLEGFNTDVLTDLAIGFLNEPDTGSFCLILSVKNLHGPYFPPERHRRKLLDATFVEPPSLEDPPDSLPAYVRHARTTPRNKFFDHGGEADREDYVRGYHQLIYSLDENIGRLRDALEERGVLENTLILCTSDGGFLWGEHGMYRKRAAYEPSIRVPLIVRWPAGVAGGLVSDRLVLNIDLAPTILSLAGAELPAGLPGRVLPELGGDGVARGSESGWRTDFLYLDAWRSSVDGPFEMAVVGERYKYIRYRWGEIEERLFDLAADPDERADLSSDPEHQESLFLHRERLQQLLEENRAPLSWLESIPLAGEDD